jgi:hypothetical protein
MTDRPDDRQLTGLLKRLIDECPHPARLIELYYWSAEHELADVMRQFVSLSADVRTALHAFLMLAKEEPGSVTVRIDPSGELTFSSPAGEELAKQVAGAGTPRPFLH